MSNFCVHSLFSLWASSTSRLSSRICGVLHIDLEACDLYSNATHRSTSSMSAMAVRTATAASHISGRSAGSSAASSGCARGLGARPASPSTTAARTPACEASNASSAAQHGTQS